MSDPDPQPEGTATDRTDDPDDPARDTRRRSRRAQVFGDVLPDGTSDERDDWGGGAEGDSDDWIRRQVPPHHG